jgi:hypothetical protein
LKALHTPQFPVNFYSFILPHFPLTSEASPSQFSSSLPKCSHFQVHSYRLPTTFRFTPTDCPLLSGSLLQIAHYFQVHSYRLPTTFKFTPTDCPLLSGSLLRLVPTHRHFPKFDFIILKFDQLDSFNLIHEEKKPSYSNRFLK